MEEANVKHDRFLPIRGEISVSVVELNCDASRRFKAEPRGGETPTLKSDCPFALRSLGGGQSMAQSRRGVRVSEEGDRAARYRERAEEVRTIANECKEPRTAAQLMQVAKDYERMARTLDIIDTTNRR